MKMKLSIIYHIFRPCVKNFSKAAVHFHDLPQLLGIFYLNTLNYNQCS